LRFPVQPASAVHYRPISIVGTKAVGIGLTCGLTCAFCGGLWNDRFGSLADLRDDFSLMSASGGKAVVRQGLD